MIIINEKKFEIRLWKLLDRYGIWQDYKHKIWDRELRDDFWNDLLKLCYIYRKKK